MEKLDRVGERRSKTSSLSESFGRSRSNRDDLRISRDTAGDTRHRRLFYETTGFSLVDMQEVPPYGCDHG